MKLAGTWVDLEVAGERCPAWRVRAAAGDERLPAIVVIQEAWGVDDHIRDVAGRLAAAGYLALAPDLHARGGRPAELQPDRIEAAKAFLDSIPPGAWGDETARAQALGTLSDDERERVSSTLAAVFAGAADRQRHLPALRAAVARVRADGDCDGRVFSIGWCMGGALSGLLACEEPALAAAVVYYGTPPPSQRAEGLRCPLLGLYGGEDRRITDAVPAFADATAAAGKSFDHHVYAGAPHAFFNDTRSSYRAAASRDAWARTLAFLTR